MTGPAGSGELATRVALVTGAGSGIGRATALALCARGAAVAVVDVDAEQAKSVRTEIESLGGRGHEYTIDLGDAAMARALVDHVVEDFGRMDILVNNAGITGQGPLLELPESAWDLAMAVNVKAPFLLIQAFGRHVAQRGGGGKVINVLSSSLFRASFISGPDYVASKGGLLGLTRAAAADLAELDVNVNAVSPGLTDTPRLSTPGLSPEERTAQLTAAVSQGPMANAFKRPSMPEDVAETIVFLCTQASRQITGQVVHTSAGAVV